MKQTLSEHGDERDVTTNGGSQRIKFCIKHGWIDLETVGGVIVWYRKHRNCQPLIIWDDEKKAA